MKVSTRVWGGWSSRSQASRPAEGPPTLLCIPDSSFGKWWNVLGHFQVLIQLKTAVVLIKAGKGGEGSRNCRRRKAWGGTSGKKRHAVGEGGLSFVASVADSHADSLAAAFHQGWLGAPVTDFLKAQPWAIAPDSHTSGHSSGCQHPLVFRVSIKTSDTPPP